MKNGKHTKKEQQMIDNYNRARANANYDLFCVYGSYSQYKGRAFDNIKDEMINNDGYDLYITTACKMFFTCAYILPKDNKQILVYYTPTNKFFITLNENDIL